MIPFTAKYSKSFSKRLSDEDVEQMLLTIEDFLQQKAAEKTEIIDNTILFCGSGGSNNWNIFATIDNGIFKITRDQNGNLVLVYKIFMSSLFIFVSLGALLNWLIFRDFLLSLIFIGWVGGMNWIIAVIRNRKIFNEITTGLIDLFKLEG